MPSKKEEASKIPAMTLEQLTENLFVLKNITDSLNIAIAGVAYASGVQKDALDKVEADEYLKWIQGTLHPLVRRTNDLHRDISKKLAKDAKKAVSKAIKKGKK